MCLFSSQSVDRIEVGCLYRRQKSKDHTDRHGEQNAQDDGRNTDRNRRTRRAGNDFSANMMPEITPITPPRLVRTTASVRNCARIRLFLAPSAFLRPISLVLSVTDTSMMFITPIPPTSSAMLAIQIKRLLVLLASSCLLRAFSRSCAPFPEGLPLCR